MKDHRRYAIRRAGRRDLPQLKRMRVALQDLLIGRDPRVWRLSPGLIDGLEDFYSQIMEKDQNRIFVAVGRHAELVAMLVVRILDNSNLDPVRFGRIDDAWVDPEWRERGVMAGLTCAAARFLADHNVSMVMLDWANNNPPSGTCWQKLGFAPLMTMGFASPTEILSRKE
ncbi:MAG TPA: GNAT family N-acetyltransferase [bacterium]|nr:GNAT family N-acetyltransferase [bacterium]